MTYSPYRAFSNMAVSLRAGAAAGMDTTIKLEPESALALAAILEMHQEALKESVMDALASTVTNKGTETND